MALENTVPSAIDIRRQLSLWAKPEAARLRLSYALGLADFMGIAAFAWGLSRAVTVLFGREPHEVTLVIWPLSVMLAGVCLRAGLTLISGRLNAEVARRIVANVRLEVMDKALAGRIADPQRLNTLFEESEQLEGYYARFHQASVQAVIFPPLFLMMIATQSPVSAGIVAFTLIPFITLMALLGLSSADESRRQLDALSRLSNLFADRLRALPLILAFGNGPKQVQSVARAAEDVAERTLSVLKVAFLTSAVLEFFSALSVALIAVYCGFYLLGQLPFASPEHLNLAKAFFVLALSPEVYAPMRRLSAAYHDRQTATAAAQRLMTIRVEEAAPAMAVRAAPVIHYDGVSCGFTDDPDFRIGPVSFTATPGTVTALIGPTGSGKTTLLRLLLGQGRLSEGAIRIDGAPAGDLSAAIGWVSQHPPILAGTLYHNLLLANRKASEAEVRAAVTAAGLTHLIETREGGLNCRLNERGSGLSGGERKRIGLARALLKNAPILLLDEPTADLDAEAEAEMIALLPRVFAGRTVILSSHSPRLCAIADQKVSLT